MREVPTNGDRRKNQIYSLSTLNGHIFIRIIKLIRSSSGICAAAAFVQMQGIICIWLVNISLHIRGRCPSTGGGK